jgi:hypothetical protein
MAAPYFKILDFETWLDPARIFLLANVKTL